MIFHSTKHENKKESSSACSSFFRWLFLDIFPGKTTNDNNASELINGSNNNKMYYRENFKSLMLNGHESASRSIYSHHLHGHNIPPPSTKREKCKMTRWDLSRMQPISNSLLLWASVTQYFTLLMFSSGSTEYPQLQVMYIFIWKFKTQ